MQVLSIGKKKRIQAVAFSLDGEELATVDGGHRVRVWNLATGAERLAAPVVVESPCGYDLAYLDRGRILLAGTNLGWWEPGADGWHVIAADLKWARRIKLSPDGQLLAEVDQTRSAELQATAGLVVRTTTDWALQPAMPSSENTTGAVAFSRDGKYLATGHMATVGHRARGVTGFPALQLQVNDYDYLVRVREMPGGRVVKSLDGWQQAVTHLAFSPDGSILAGTAGPRLRVWDLNADREVALHKRGTKHFQGLSFARDGSFLATVSNDATVRVWNARTWQEHTTYTWDVGRLLNIAFAPDGLRAAAGSDTGRVVIWDVE